MSDLSVLQLNDEEMADAVLAIGAGWGEEFIPEDELVEASLRFNMWIAEARWRITVFSLMRRGEVTVRWDPEEGDWMVTATERGRSAYADPETD